MKDQIILTQEQVKLLAAHWEPLSFESDFDFNYENQILNGAIALTEGKIEILKKSKLIGIIDPGSIVGLQSVTKNKKVKYQMRIKAGSKIVLVSKSGLQDLTGLIGQNALS